MMSKQNYSELISDNEPSYNIKFNIQTEMSDAGLTKENVEKILGNLLN